MSEIITPEINPEAKLPHINFNYSPESEKARVLYTVSRNNFYNDNYNNKAFTLPLPEGSTMDALTDDYEEVIKRELEPKKAQEIQNQLFKDFKENYEAINSYLSNLGFEFPKDFSIQFTQYGTGGSYLYRSPDKMGVVMNIRRNRNFLSTLIHELTHLAIHTREQELKISQHEKESIVDYLILNNEQIKQLASDHQAFNFGEPSEELLRKLGLK